MSGTNDFNSLADLPPEITSLKTWLVWRLMQKPGMKKPRKVPFYVNGQAREGGQGGEADLQNLVEMQRSIATAQKGGYNGVGLAMLKAHGLVALDFDDCVVDGVIIPEVRDVIEGTYSEFSPSGTGIRAFFRGEIRDKKDHNESKRYPFAIEFFCSTGYVTITGNRTPDCSFFGWGIADMPDRVRALYRQRFGSEGPLIAASVSQDDDWFLSTSELKQKVGISLDKAKALLGSLNADCGYQEWLNTGQSLHHEFDGSDEGFELWKEWSKSSTEGKYPGDRALRSKWESFGSYTGHPITGAYLLRHAKDAKVLEKYEAVADWKDKIKAAVLERQEMELREKLCPQIAKDARLTDIEREGLAQVLLDSFKALGTKLTIAFCRKLIAPPEKLTPTVKQKRPLTEFGNTDRMLDRYGDSLMYVPETDAWYVWTGVYWRRSTKTDVEHYAKETVRSLVNEAEEHEQELAEFFEFCRDSQRAKMVANMVQLASSDPRVMVPASELDKHSGLLCVQNGVVDLKTGRLMEPDPSYRMTRCCSCDYVPEAKAPLFKKVLSDAFYDDREMCEFFMLLMGYAIVGDPVQDIMVIPYGNGSNGKSTIFGTIRKVLGTYARSCAPETFVSDGKGSNGGGPREDIVRLQGARFVYVAEPDEGAELREGAIKGMTGGDSIPARAMYARISIEVEPTWVPFMPTNHKPVVKGNDNGIWRRLVLLPFTRNFETDPLITKDEKLAEKLAAEAEGVLAMCVLAAGAYLRGGLKQPASIKKAREEYRSQMDLLAEWLEERCELGEGYVASSKDLWASWESFAKQRGVLQYVKSSIALGKRLDQRFPSARDPSGTSRVRMGIRLRALEVNAGDWADGFFQS